MPITRETLLPLIMSEKFEEEVINDALLCSLKLRNGMLITGVCNSRSLFTKELARAAAYRMAISKLTEHYEFYLRQTGTWKG